MLDDAGLVRRGHLNLVEFCRETARWSGAAGRVEESDGVMLFATGAPLPVLCNGAFALDPAVAPAVLLDRADAWFGQLGRGYTVWADDTDVGHALAAAAEGRGMVELLDYPQMVVRRPVGPHPLPQDVSLRWVTDADTMNDFVSVQADAYSVYGMPPEAVQASITDVRAFTEPHVHSVVAYTDGRPVAAAQTVLSHGIAGVYWVGTVDGARGKGLGDAVTRVVTNRAFELGAGANSLQASPMGEAIYARMGYETLYRYRGFVRLA